MVINGGDMCPMFSHTVIEKETRCFLLKNKMTSTYRFSFCTDFSSQTSN